MLSCDHIPIQLEIKQITFYFNVSIYKFLMFLCMLFYQHTTLTIYINYSPQETLVVFMFRQRLDACHQQIIITQKFI